ncbi:toxin YdaT family protein [Enterobacter hormaechei]|uniref:Bacterial toxin ydaT n=1 Tax=Pseudocitrobacter vendiensis TaxID=2488306 RepID=A0ABM9F5H2_9ENTR|nr:toxin YdaT family protein [Pseudocitrobacter vendiensis]CAH6636028.1 Putative bacterial toxin ydaT [Pseudocitrobacter vendiensis]
MHSLTYHENNGFTASPMISVNQSVPRNNSKLTRIREAVRAWQKATPGQAQVHISQLVAKEWLTRGGRGLLLAGSEHNTKQNFFRMINDPGPKNDKGLVLLIPVIVDVMARDNEKVAREFGLVAKTEAELIAEAMKECTEAHQAKLLGQPIQRLEKEVREAAEALLRFLPTESIAAVVTSLAAMAPGVM